MERDDLDAQVENIAVRHRAIDDLILRECIPDDGGVVRSVPFVRPIPNPTTPTRVLTPHTRLRIVTSPSTRTLFFFFRFFFLFFFFIPHHPTSESS